MSQKTSADKVGSVSTVAENVAENWTYYDTVLIGQNLAGLSFNDGWHPNYLALGLQADVPFFNVRNKNHGLPYNNQDTRDALPFAFRIFTIGVRFWAPSCANYPSDGIGEQQTPSVLFATELAKHCSVTLQTNQDDRLKSTVQLTPPGYGLVGGGVGQGDMEGLSASFNAVTTTDSGGVPILTNKWGFYNPLEIPRRANLSVVLKFNDYGKNLLQAMPGPLFTQLRDVAADGSYYDAAAISGMQVVLGGQRLVQQRGQYHA